MTQDKLIGKQLDEYRLLALLGRGGMARVYLAEDVRLKRKVAMKVIDPPFRTDSEYMMRFEREAQAVARLEHPHIVRLYRYGDVNGLLYMAMQYVDGPDLRGVLSAYRDSNELIEMAEAARVIREVCEALDYAHGQGVIHRDIKPSNILLGKDGCAYLADFGLVRMRGTGTQGKIFGSPHYIAPEQAISSASTSPQSDLYSVGVMLYQMFTGQLPFDAPNPTDVAMLHVTERPRPLTDLNSALSPAVERVVLKVLSKEPAARYSSGAKLVAALDQALKAVHTDTPTRYATLIAHPGIIERKSSDDSLPPIPAAVAVPGSDRARKQTKKRAGSQKPAPMKRKRKARRLPVYLSAVAALIVIVLAAVLLPLNGDDGDSPVGVGLDRDADGVLDTVDKCPDLAGLSVATGCEVTGFVVITEADQNAQLRAAPSTTAEVLGWLENEQWVVLLGRSADSNWLRVRAFNNANRQEIEAWVSELLVVIVDFELDVLPVLTSE
ncbi:MAG: protein kinase [Anaerolineae bacterium]|nr:protein kinase [Anaerolineae bacterium]